MQKISMSSSNDNSTLKTLGLVFGGAAAAWLLASYLNKKENKPQAAASGSASAAPSDDGEKKLVAPKTPFLRSQTGLPPPLDLVSVCVNHT